MSAGTYSYVVAGALGAYAQSYFCLSDALLPQSALRLFIICFIDCVLEMSTLVSDMSSVLTYIKDQHQQSPPAPPMHTAVMSKNTDHSSQPLSKKSEVVKTAKEWNDILKSLAKSVSKQQ